MALKTKIIIIGCGPGALECITLEALAEIQHADVLIGTVRLLEMFPEAAAKLVPVGGNRAETFQAIKAHEGKRIAILVTGDPGVASLASAVIEDRGIENCRLLPGISSVQVAFARLGLSWDTARVLSAHASLPNVEPACLSLERTIAVLTGGAESIRWVASLARSLGKQWRVVVAQDLTLSTECIFDVTPDELERLAAPLRAVIILNRKSRA